jgi:hypothetical protein
MLRSMLFAVAAAIVGSGAMATEATAGWSDGQGQDAHAAAYSMPQQRHWHVARRSFTRDFGGYYGYAVRPRASALRGPGYIYVPGIVDGACNLPTSPCSNEFRNVN